jgi:hypothetical protein
LELLPTIERTARYQFRYIRCPNHRAECVAETCALAWKWFVRLYGRGKDAGHFVAVFARFASRAVKCGRRATGQESSRDVMSRAAQQRHGFQVSSLGSSVCWSHGRLYGAPQGQEMLDSLEERLHSNTQTPIPDQVAFRMDWPRFFHRLSRRDRQLATFLSLGNSAKAAADKFGVSPGRVTQLRQSWCRAWREFEEPDAVAC